MSSSALSSTFCFNHECSEFNLKHYRPGWRLRTGDFANLCGRCASAYEQGKFCDIFHQRASGWRSCECCGKRIHCGCIVSASSFMLLDAGGIECSACTRIKVSLGPKFARPQSFFHQSPVAEKFRDLSINWSSSTRSNQKSCLPPSLFSPSVLRFDLHNHGDGYEFSQPTCKGRATVCSVEKTRGVNDLMGRLMSENSKSHTVDILNNQKAGPHRLVPPCPNANIYHPLISLKKGPCGTQLAFPVPITTTIEKNGHSRLDGSNLQHTPNSSPLSCLPNDFYGGLDSTFGSKSWNFGTHLDTPGKLQVVPRYWPMGLNKNQDLQNLSKESNVTPLFEKILSASDAGRVGRLVVPKKCAEAYFPRISDPEGVPLKLQDSMGKEWTFQFRFWPNSSSRMYFLEGVNACIQSRQLQAGDTVVFSRIDPERKLIMDFRKASVAQSSDQKTDSEYNIRDTCTDGDTEPVDTHSPSRVKKPAYIAKGTPGVEISFRKKKSRMMITRSKRQKVEKRDLIELKLTWEEAQGFLLPPPDFTPSIVVIEEFEFEEYEDPPIIGKPTVCTDDTGVRSTCSTDQDLIAGEHDEEAMKGIEGHLMSPKVTRKHPRHRSDCTCIICLQSPSGTGPKHDQCCSCMVCDMKKRRKRSLVLWRENKLIEKAKKKRIEKEKNAHKKLEPLTSDEELHQSANISKNHEEHHHTSSLKGQIDLNFQPEKEEGSLPRSNTTTKNKSLQTLHNHDTVKSSFKPPSSSSCHSQIDKEDKGKLKTRTEAADTTTSSS